MDSDILDLQSAQELQSLHFRRRLVTLPALGRILKLHRAQRLNGRQHFIGHRHPLIAAGTHALHRAGQGVRAGVDFIPLYAHCFTRA